MLCEICGQNPATVQITRIDHTGKHVQNLCEVCAAKARGGSFNADYPPYSFFGESPFYDIPFRSYQKSANRPTQQQSVNVMDYFTQRAKDALQSAAQISQEMGHQVVDTEHLLLAVLKEEKVARKIIEELGLNAQDIEKYIKELVPKGTAKVESIELSPRAKRVLELAFDEARQLNHNYVGSEHILLALVREGEGLAAQTLKKYGVDLVKMRSVVLKLVGQGIADGESVKEESKTPTLDKYTRDLTNEAKEGKLDPVIGRAVVIERIVNILSRRRKNNPVLIGEPGVGKTAVVEGLAQKIVNNEVPDTLKDKRLLALDLGSLVAGTKYRGEFEERLKEVIKEIESNKENMILFIDELHTIVGAGGSEGAIDASNLLKPALARGDLRAIGATTLNEYKKYIEKDAALERRFQPVLLPENTVLETIDILRGLKDRYEAHHRVKIEDEAVVAAAELSDRYVKDRYLPDKAIDLIDEACAEVRLRSIEPPANLQAIKKEIQEVQRELSSAKSSNDEKRVKELQDKLDELKSSQKEVEDLWNKEKATETPVVKVEHVASVLSKMTGIPVSELTQEERERLLNLEKELHKRIVGQEEAVKAVSEAIRRARAGLKPPHSPIGTFMFLGPTGVGKTELARALAEFLYGDERHMVRLDMSEFQEKHNVARLIGSPPGYVGHEEGGQLTERVRRNPYSIILFDEIEKAHDDVFNILLQIMDEGRLTDGKGRTVDFSNAIIILTSNLGSDLIRRSQAENMAQEKLNENVEKILKSRFRPEFINRIDEFIIFHSLTKEQIRQIVDLQLEKTARLTRAQEIELVIDDNVRDYIAENGYEPDFGARPIRRLIMREIETGISKVLLEEEFNPGDKIKVSLDKNGMIKFTHAKSRRKQDKTSGGKKGSN